MSWDPMGVSGMSEASDEYDGYHAPTLRLLERDASVQAIATYLDTVAFGHMGLASVSIPSTQFAARLKAWFADKWHGTSVLGER